MHRLLGNEELREEHGRRWKKAFQSVGRMRKRHSGVGREIGLAGSRAYVKDLLELHGESSFCKVKLIQNQIASLCGYSFYSGEVGVHPLPPWQRFWCCDSFGGADSKGLDCHLVKQQTFCI